MFVRRCLTLVVGAFFVLLTAGSQGAETPATSRIETKVTVTRDIPYAAPGGDPKLNSLDIYAPEGKTKCPVVVFIHGGGWQIGDKRSGAQAKGEGFPQQGYVFVSINYRLAPKVKHPVLVQDVAKAIAYVHANIAKYGGDPDRIFVMGHSAGAHLAALVSTDDRYLKAEGLTLKNLRGTILLDGGSYNMSAAGTKKASKMEPITDAFGSDQAVWKAASPIYNVASGKDIPPFLIIYVSYRADTKSQSEELAKALNKAGVTADVKPALNKSHETLNKELGLPGDVPTQQVYAFLSGLTGNPIVAINTTDALKKPAKAADNKQNLRRALRSLNLTSERKEKAKALMAQYKGDRKNPEFRKAFLDLLTPEQRKKAQGLLPE